MLDNATVHESSEESSATEVVRLQVGGWFRHVSIQPKSRCSVKQRLRYERCRLETYATTLNIFCAQAQDCTGAQWVDAASYNGLKVCKEPQARLGDTEQSVA